ncbi:cytochrome P450 [Murinocardiopsis flavida]|uniref:Cytochrome P450 n=1 Tax=Murinocardiopsis flavida TaxID=645275 RepID=A0A2P8DDR0_9ACTN|nr:cytochrome P450 [Murinocardiopsis flavida]PSK95363.1 cytochrome P450 [Murinocardiopsis flavida]
MQHRTPEHAAERPTEPGPGRSEPVPFPRDRPKGCPFDPPTELAHIRAERPLVRLAYPDGPPGWLATGHAVVRAVLADPRFSGRYELLRLPFPGMPAEGLPPAPIGDLTGIDPPEHTRLRKPLAGKFTVRRMRLLTERVEQITAECLDAMAEHGPPVDLLTMYAQPIPTMMICELLGAPYADHAFFRRHTETLISQSAPGAEQEAALAAIHEYLGELVLAKRANPTDDLLSDLTDTDLTDAELAGVGGFLLGAGLDTTASMLALGTFALLRDPDQLAALRTGDGDGIDRAVEELMRYLAIAETGARAALEDVELDGQLIKAGETVVLSLLAANRDPERFPDPDTLDLRRNATGHLGFGHGVHQCLGQQLARVEMRVAFPALFARFPTLRLAVPPEEVPLRSAANIYGVRGLPVTWDGV